MKKRQIFRNTASRAFVLVLLLGFGVGFRHAKAEPDQPALVGQPSASEPAYIVTVPMVGLLIEDLMGADTKVVVISESLDYHAPQVTPKQLQSWMAMTDILWFGSKMEPQMQGIVEKIAGQSQARVVSLPIFGQEPQNDTHDEPHHAPKDKNNREHRHDHHHGHDHTYAHPWLHVETLRAWAKFLSKYADLSSNNSYTAWSTAFEQMISDWQERFAALDNRSFVQEHAALEPLAHTFNLVPVGALTSHHDTAVGLRELFVLKKEIRQQKTRCFVAMPDSQMKVPPTLFKGEPNVRVIDPLVSRGVADKAQQSQFKSVMFLSNILEALYSCLQGS